MASLELFRLKGHVHSNDLTAYITIEDFIKEEEEEEDLYFPSDFTDSSSELMSPSIK